MLITIIGLAAMIATTTQLTAGPQAADLLFSDDFENNLADAWRAYDNWAEPEFGITDESPLDAGAALRVAFDDTSTVSHFDKGALLDLPQPIQWRRLDFITARYHINNEVGNMRIFCHCDKGGWWDYRTTDVRIGESATIIAHRRDFRLAWTDDPEKPAPDKTGNIVSVYFSVHNKRPVNSGEQFVLHLDDVRMGTWLLPIRQPLDCSAPRRNCWPIATCETPPNPMQPSTMANCVAIRCGQATVWAAAVKDRIHLAGITPKKLPVSVNERQVTANWGSSGESRAFTASIPRAQLDKAGSRNLQITCGDGRWSGRYTIVRAVRPHEALALTLRTGGANCRATEETFIRGEPVGIVVDLPRPWAGAEMDAALTTTSGKQWQLSKTERAALTAGSRITAETASGATDISAGRYHARVNLRPGSGSLTAVLPITVSELDRDSLSKQADAARRRAKTLARRAANGETQPWWAEQSITTEPKVRHRSRVRPSQWSQIPDPVKWEDLGGKFRGGAQCGIDEKSLKRYFDHYDFGRVIKPHLGYLIRDGWRRKLKAVAERDLIITSVWGYVPGRPWNGGFGHVEIPLEKHREILDILGRQFLGYEMGEQDGRYIGSYAPKHDPRTRRQAKKLFDDWHQDIIDNFHGYMVALASLNYLHDYARLGLRMMGIEASQGLPSDIMEWAFIRGASKQWGALTWNCISIFNRRGHKSYTSTGENHGPEKGPSIELLRRLWYVTYMYGSAVNMFESAYFTDETDDGGFPRLSPVGKCHVDAVKWAREHPDRGVQYTPVAIMLDRDSGWTPPRHLYTGKRHLVWGNIAYSRADDATDAFFRRIWPQYQDCSYYRDERGYLTATPFGDMFDVVLSDAPSHCLDRYQTLIIFSLPGTATDGLCRRLQKFIEGGGEVICDYTVARKLGPDLTGLELTDDHRTAQFSVLLPDGRLLDEDPYTYQVAKPRGAKALSVSDRGDGILFDYSAGPGRVTTCMALNYGAAETNDPQPDIDVPLRHRLLRTFMAALRPYLHSLNPVRVQGAPVQYICNVCENPNRLIVTVVNNEKKRASVRITPRRGRFAECEPWLGEPALRDGAVRITLPAGDFAVFKTHLSQPAN